jgi:curli biogenesis system outer membrane secretion channel CsgG
MRKALTLTVLTLSLAACRSGEVRKDEPVVAIKSRTPRPMDQRKMVAVVDFEDKTAYGQGRGRLGPAAADVLTKFLFDSAQFRLISRAQIAKLLEEQKFQQSGAVNPQTAVQIGKLIGAKLIAYGAVTNFGIRSEGTEAVVYQEKEQIAEAQVDVQLIDVETGEILFVGEGRGSAIRATRGSLGLGGRASYDETLAGDSLRAAIAKMIDNLIDMGAP